MLLIIVKCRTIKLKNYLQAHQNYEKLKKSQEESEEEANKASGSAKEAKV